MKIIKRDAYKIGQDELIAENVKEIDACLICHLLNKNKGNDYTYYYQVMTDEYKIKE